MANTKAPMPPGKSARGAATPLIQLYGWSGTNGSLPTSPATTPCWLTPLAWLMQLPVQPGNPRPDMVPAVQRNASLNPPLLVLLPTTTEPSGLIALAKLKEEESGARKPSAWKHGPSVPTQPCAVASRGSADRTTATIAASESAAYFRERRPTTSFKFDQRTEAN